MSEHPKVKLDHDMGTIEIPNGTPVIKGNYRSHYLWIGGRQGSCWATIQSKRELKKLRNMIDLILGDKP